MTYETETGFDCFKKQAESFVTEMPYKREPYCGRNWGGAWHSLCSYHGKLKPSIAHFLVSRFTKTGDTVLDPLCGVGTIPFEACIQGRFGIGNDLSEIAYVVTKAKLETPDMESVLSVIDELREYTEHNLDAGFVDEKCEACKSFGFNGKLPEYFHSETYREIICARFFFIERFTRLSSADSVALSAFLHILHGNRPYALSRRSHPLTPYAPKGEYEYKNVADHIEKKVRLTYKKDLPGEFVKGRAMLGDYSEILGIDGKVDAIICSPPFAGSIRFYMNNWMRLWLCGWEDGDFKKAGVRFLEARQQKDFSAYDSFFKMCGRVLKPSGRVILHLGSTGKINMADELSRYAAPYFTEAFRGSEDVSGLEKHGITDKGATVGHEFLFLEKNRGLILTSIFNGD